MSDTVEIVLATRNPGKVREMRELLKALPIELRTVEEMGEAPEVEEDAPDLQGNARKKAMVLHEHTGLAALADDTGLEVDALGGAPGVRSARYAGPEADDAANRARLLEELDGTEDRAAQFRTVVAFAEQGDVRFFEGICRGRVIEAERGEGGFGYDALFVPEGRDRTFAEMSDAEKNAISHRGRALRAAADYLRATLAD